MFALVSLLPRTDLRRRQGTRETAKSSSDRRPLAMKQLPPLLSVASELDLDDEVGWTSLGVAASRVMDGLVGSGELPRRLRLQPDAPPAVVAETLAVAWRQVSALPGQSQQRM